MKTLRGELKPNIIHLIDISLIALHNDDQALVQSAVECLKIYHLYPQKSLKNQKTSCESKIWQKGGRQNAGVAPVTIKNGRGFL